LNTWTIEIAHWGITNIFLQPYSRKICMFHFVDRHLGFLSDVDIIWWSVGVDARSSIPPRLKCCGVCLHVVIFGLPQRRLWSSCRPVVQHLATERFRWLPHAPRTLCHPRCEQSSHLRCSGTAKQNCSSPTSPRPNCLHLTVLLYYQHVCL